MVGDAGLVARMERSGIRETRPRIPASSLHPGCACFQMCRLRTSSLRAAGEAIHFTATDRDVPRQSSPGPAQTSSFTWLYRPPVVRLSSAPG
ncbi:MAG TPA: hypothetical protein ENO16_06605 [Chromatiales bacterium]|nr:hypothetical protein [Chromatiales bacterium]